MHRFCWDVNNEELLMQVTGTAVVPDTQSKVRVLLLPPLRHHKSRVLDTMLMMRVQETLVVQWCVTQTARTCALLGKEDSATSCQWNEMTQRAAVPMSVPQGPIQQHRWSRSGSMITLGITATTHQLVLSPSTAQHSTRDLLYSNSVNCSISVNVASMLCHTLCIFQFVTPVQPS